MELHLKKQSLFYIAAWYCIVYWDEKMLETVEYRLC